MKPPSKIGATAGRKLFTSDSASSSGSSSSDSSDFSSSTTSAKGTGAPSGALVVKRRASRSRSLKTPKLPEPPKTHEDFVHLTQVSSTAVIPTDYPILVAPAEDMRRLMGVPRRRRFTALEARRQMRNELGRLRASVSQMWFLCLLVLAALSVPAGLVIAPFISFGDFQSTTAGHPGGWTLPFTGDPLANLSRDCLRPLKLSDDIKQLNMHNITVHAVPAHKGDLICVFNNSRFRKAQRYDYVPVIMPLSLCNSLLYWSVAVVDGVVRNRVPEFDVHYGVYRMPQLVGRLATGGSLPPLLIGVGGHRQDSAHLSRLGRDPIVHSKFGASLLRFSDKHGIGGAVIDWKPPRNTANGVYPTPAAAAAARDPSGRPPRIPAAVCAATPLPAPATGGVLYGANQVRFGRVPYIKGFRLPLRDPRRRTWNRLVLGYSGSTAAVASLAAPPSVAPPKKQPLQGVPQGDLRSGDHSVTGARRRSSPCPHGGQLAHSTT